MQMVKQSVDKLLFGINVLLLVTMTVLSIYQVFTRYFLDVPSTISEEMVRFLLIWFALFTTAYVFGQQKHIAITVLLQRFTERMQLVIFKLIQVFWFLLSTGSLIIGGIILITYTTQETSAALGISMMYVYLALPLSGLFMAFYSLWYLAMPAATTEEMEGNE
ncbi:TRAP transporter small permease [Salibacterium qingdaonense]|uniref:TRAP-type C4-dicarboxylate transport system, small permease component n=1 Tax=Salibacterium qingdaonense TaxID=266892 RepID=A0A1I4N3S0_9BACI|nr:TRAP transporter small permease [Salibacterium qingdaonense]SFM09913.1 TRAP-type C4-dicarboxylate transport system, small permease component [Salibacterium qingdaonense]